MRVPEVSTDTRHTACASEPTVVEHYMEWIGCMRIRCVRLSDGYYWTLAAYLADRKARGLPWPWLTSNGRC